MQFVQPAAVGIKVPGALPNLPGTFLDVSIHGGKNDPAGHTETGPVIQNITLVVVKSFIVSVPSTKNAEPHPPVALLLQWSSLACQPFKTRINETVNTFVILGGARAVSFCLLPFLVETTTI